MTSLYVLGDLPDEMRDAVRQEIVHDEKLLWVGQPDAGRLARATTPILFFGVPWTAFALFWTWGATGFGKAFEKPGPFLLFPLFGLPFILIGLGMLSAPYWAYRKGLQTVYAVTDRRILILTVGKRRSVETHIPRNAAEFERTEAPDGTGDVIFAKNVGYDSDGDRTIRKNGFYGIKNVRYVERLLQETFLGARGR